MSDPPEDLRICSGFSRSVSRDQHLPVDTRHEVLNVLQELARPGVRVGVRTIESTPMFEVEWAHVCRATERRVHEFGSGRGLLRDLMMRNIPIPVGSDRAPVLPADVRGSLAHDAEIVVAAIADHLVVRSVGIDIEPVETLDDLTARTILRPDEDLDAHLAFTLKEATYKAWSGLGGRMLDFHEVRLSVTGQAFSAEIMAPARLSHGLHLFDGLFANAAGRWIALVVVPARS